MRFSRRSLKERTVTGKVNLRDAEDKVALEGEGKPRSRANSTGKDPVKRTLVCSKNDQKANVAESSEERREWMRWDRGCGPMAWWILFKGNHWGVLNTGQDLCSRQSWLCSGPVFIWELLLTSD